MFTLSRKLSLLLLFAAVAFALIVPALAASAQTKSVVVQRRDGDITILPNGDVQVLETWVVQFAGGPFHTAFRTLDLNRIDGVDDIGVSEGDKAFTINRGVNSETPGTLNTGATDKNLKIQWFFDPTTDSTRTFMLRYTLHGVLRIYPQGDQLWWQFIESERGYPINAAHVVVHLPAAVAANQLDLDVVGSGYATRMDDRTVAFDGGPFGPNSVWEIRTQFPHGLVTSPPPSWQAAADAAAIRQEQELAQQQVTQFAQLAGGIVVLVGGLAGALALYYTRIRQKPAALTAEFLSEPPDSLAPGLAGGLLDGKVDTQDIVATLVDLARRGFVKMSDNSGDYAFDRVGGKNASALRPWEQQLLDNFFSVATHRQMSDPTDQIFLTLRAPVMEGLMADELVNEGYFATPPTGNSHSPLFWVMTALFWGAIAYGLLSFFIFHNFSPLTLFDIIVVLIVTTVITRVEQARSHSTTKGVEAAAKWNAFKRYLQDINKYTQVAEAKALFEKYLAFAIAFGVSDKWLNAFAAVDTPAPPWYQRDNLHEDEPNATHTVHDRPGEGRTGSAVTPSGSGGSGGASAPSLNEMADNSFRGLNSMSASFAAMLNTTASAFKSPSADTSGSSSGGDHDFSSSDHSSSSSHSWSGGGSKGGASGGGSSGFG